MSDKYNEIESKYKQLEEEKFDISNKLHEANDKINEYKENKSNKGMIEEQDQMKIKYDETIQIQKEKIQQLEKIVEFQNTSPREDLIINVNNQNILIQNSKQFFNELFRFSEKNNDLKGILQNFTKQFEKSPQNSANKGDVDLRKTSSNKKNSDTEENIVEAPKSLEEFMNEKKKFQNEKKYILKTLEEKAERVLLQ